MQYFNQTKAKKKHNLEIEIEKKIQLKKHKTQFNHKYIFLIQVFFHPYAC